MQPVNLTVTIVPSTTDEPAAVGYGFKLVDSAGNGQVFYGNGADPVITSSTTIAEGVYSVFAFTHDVNQQVVGNLVPTDTPTIEIKAPVIVTVAIKTIASASIVVA